MKLNRYEFASSQAPGGLRLSVANGFGNNMGVREAAQVVPGAWTSKEYKREQQSPVVE